MPKKSASPSPTVRSRAKRKNFPDTSNFVKQTIRQPLLASTAEGWRSRLWSTEIRDAQQKITARPYIAWGVGALLILQNVGIYIIVITALNKGVLKELQLIFSTLVAGSLTQSYFLLRLITGKIFGDINYHNGEVNK